MFDVMLPRGSKVVIVVSSGAPEEGGAFVEMPSITELAQGAALAKLQAANLRAFTQYDYSTVTRKGAVGSQYPLAGTLVPQGSDVLALVSSGDAPGERSPRALPEIIGRERDEARRLLRDAGFSPEVLVMANDQVKPGFVFAQIPYETSAVFTPKRASRMVWVLVAFLVAIIAVVGFFVMQQKGKEAALDAFLSKNAEFSNVAAAPYSLLKNKKVDVIRVGRA